VGSARPLFDAINTAQHPHFLNCHEYLGYHIRYGLHFYAGATNGLLEDLQDMGVLTDKIKILHRDRLGKPGSSRSIIITGQGYRGFLMSGVTPEQLAEDLYVAFQTVYTDPHFIGSCIFTYGAYGWEDFDLLLEQRILQRIYELISTEFPVIDTEVTTFKVVVGSFAFSTIVVSSSCW
jgi:hypothetical protein